MISIFMLHLLTFCVSKLLSNSVCVVRPFGKAQKLARNSVQFNLFKFIIWTITYDMYDVLRFLVLLLLLLLLFCWDLQESKARARKGNKKGNKKVIKEKDQRKFADNCRMHDECMVKWMSVEVRWSEAVEVQE